LPSHTRPSHWFGRCIETQCTEPRQHDPALTLTCRSAPPAFILMKQTGQTRGVPLAGLAVKVTNGYRGFGPLLALCLCAHRHDSCVCGTTAATSRRPLVGEICWIASRATPRGDRNLVLCAFSNTAGSIARIADDANGTRTRRANWPSFANWALWTWRSWIALHALQPGRPLFTGRSRRTRLTLRGLRVLSARVGTRQIFIFCRAGSCAARASNGT
jgi:hypothetical protein